MATGFLTHDRFLDHSNGPGHPERPDRLVSIWRRLHQSGTRERLVALEPAVADRASLTQVHSSNHVDGIERLSATGRTTGLTPDTGISRGTFEAARLASGGAVTAVDAVVSGTVDNAFCAAPPSRPPRRTRAGDGVLLFQSRRRRGRTPSPPPRNPPPRHRRLGRPPRQRHTAHTSNPIRTYCFSAFTSTPTTPEPAPRRSGVSGPGSERR